MMSAALAAIAVFSTALEKPLAEQDNFKGDAAIQFGVSLIAEGKKTFRYDTFGDEAFWGDTLRMHEVIAGEANGGIGPGVSPSTALSLGLKVDSEALPQKLKQDIVKGRVDLDDPATTVALLKLDAVVGAKGFFDSSGKLENIGFTCALCHSDVDDSFAPGIGKRLDGWPARDLHFGDIVATSPNLEPFQNLLGVDRDTVIAVLKSWGPGKFDASLLLDGKAFRPDGQPAATLIPPAYGLAGVNLHTYTGWGGVSHWNAFVGNLEMQGQGRFYDPRLADEEKFPIAAANGMDDVKRAPDEDRVTSKLAGLQMYQLSIPAPRAPEDSYNPAIAQFGEELFNGKAKCASCHVPPLFTEPGHNIRRPEEIGIDSFLADRGPTGGYRTTPLMGAWARSTGGYYHDGRFTTLNDVVNHYNQALDLNLTNGERQAIVEYINSL